MMRWPTLLLSSAALLATHGSASAQIGAAAPTVVCDGLACGGSGGASGSQFLYRVQPGPSPVAFLEVPVEDGNLTNYRALAGPEGWSWEMRSSAGGHNELRAGHGTARVERRGKVEASRVASQQRLAEAAHVAGVDEGDRAAAETRAGHARAVAGRLPARELRDRVELLARDLVEVAEARVRVVHEAPRPREVALPDPDLPEKGLRIREERGPPLAARQIVGERERLLRSIELVAQQMGPPEHGQ